MAPAEKSNSSPRTRPELEQFVRHSLGCTCPEEVFAQIDEAPSQLSREAGISHRIDIGGRLLIYVVRVRGSVRPETLGPRMAEWVAAGWRERDRATMNRLRLIVVLDQLNPEQEAVLRGAFDLTRPQGDDRIHLHILATHAIAGLLPDLPVADIG